MDLEAKMSELENRVKKLEEQHGARLDGHDRDIAEVKSQLGRILNNQTTQGLIMERVEITMQQILTHVRGPR